MKTKKKCHMDLFLWAMFIIITVWILSLIFLLGLALFNSFKHWYDFDGLFQWPSPEYGFQLESYTQMWTTFYVDVIYDDGSISPIYVEQMLLNSLVYSFVVTLVMISTQVMVAYATAKYNFKFRNLLYFVAIVVMLIPIVGSLPSEMQMADKLGLKNNVLGIAIMKSKYPGIYFLIFYAMFKNVSWTYAEAAQIDGAGHWQIMLQIMIPLVSSTIFGVFILLFISNWNEYFTPMLFMPEFPTIAYGLYEYNNSSNELIGPPQKFAACLVTCLPIIILFILFRNKIMGNLSMGGLKG